MCGRYSLFTPPEDIEARFGATFTESFQPRYNAAPSQSLPVITDASPERIDTKEWGFVPPWADSRSDFGFINARAETVTEKPTFRDAVTQSSRDGFRMGRCLVPADGFYEWVDDGSENQPYRVTLADDEPFAMAGLWAEWQPPQTQTGLDAFSGGDGSDTSPDVVETFTIVTTEPNEFVADLHHRMAVILDGDERDRWLTGAAEEATALLDPYDGEMRAYPVSTAVNDPSNDSPALVEPVGE
ncbi:SOS response-associated peptidase [Salinibaculum rarum]|uniref:SOS response-associated peptidase n=1 Tax=Salinibaculum rarum TaxID=3058903 RepID=UPI00265FA738|nr:SOS response-associated peptidase [Salinibaculum sp. KK48]